MNRSDARSLALHRAVAEKLRHEPALWTKVRANVERMIASAPSGLSHSWGVLWNRRLDASHEEILAFICESSDTAQQYRSSSPFAGVLSAKERASILSSTTDETVAA